MSRLVRRLLWGMGRGGRGRRRVLTARRTDLTRQYKTMQAQLQARIMEFQETEKVLREELGAPRVAPPCLPTHAEPPPRSPPAASAKREIVSLKEETARIVQEKDDTIASLTQRIQTMESLYENVLNVRRRGPRAAAGGRSRPPPLGRRRSTPWRARLRARATAGRSSRCWCSATTR
jgi:hypothetical protein